MADASPNVLRLVRQSHEQRVLAALRTKGAMSRAALGERTGLSRATLSAIVRDLLQHNALIEVRTEDEPQRSRGRPVTQLALNPAGGVALGLDLGHRRVYAAIANVAHEIVASASESCAERTPWARRLDIAVRLVQELVEQSDLTLDALGGVGVGVVGPVSTTNGPSPGRRGRVNLIRDGLAERFGVPIHVDNNTRLAALAEAIWGAGSGLQNVLYVRLSYGVGGGLVLGGHLYAGAAGGSGELGHVSVDPLGPPCPCGGHGCLEQHVSISALLEQCHARRFDQVLRRLEEGDERVRGVIDAAGKRIGQVLAASCNVLNPEAVVVGGELAAAGDHLMRPIRSSIEQYTHKHLQSGLRVDVAQLGDKGAARGAIALVLREWELLAGYPGASTTEAEAGTIDVAEKEA